MSWYLTQQALWFRTKLGGGILRAASTATITMLLATIAAFLFGLMLFV